MRDLVAEALVDIESRASDSDDLMSSTKVTLQIHQGHACKCSPVHFQKPRCPRISGLAVYPSLFGQRSGRIQNYLARDFPEGTVKAKAFQNSTLDSKNDGIDFCSVLATWKSGGLSPWSVIHGLSLLFLRIITTTPRPHRGSSQSQVPVSPPCTRVLTICLITCLSWKVLVPTTTSTSGGSPSQSQSHPIAHATWSKHPHGQKQFCTLTSKRRRAS